jgi:hypothetical protein
MQISVYYSDFNHYYVPFEIKSKSIARSTLKLLLKYPKPSNISIS